MPDIDLRNDPRDRTSQVFLTQSRWHLDSGILRYFANESKTRHDETNLSHGTGVNEQIVMSAYEFLSFL